jgi:hypothetical protein
MWTGVRPCHRRRAYPSYEYPFPGLSLAASSPATRECSLGPAVRAALPLRAAVTAGLESVCACLAGKGHEMAGLVGTVTLADLTPVAAEAGAAEGDPRPVYTWTGPPAGALGLVGSYLPSDGAAPRLVAASGEGAKWDPVPSSSDFLGVWDTGTGAFLGALTGPPGVEETVWSLVTYQRPSDGRPRIAAGPGGGRLCIWDGDDLRLLHAVDSALEGHTVYCLAVYEDPTSGSTRLVSG